MNITIASLKKFGFHKVVVGSWDGHGRTIDVYDDEDCLDRYFMDGTRLRTEQDLFAKLMLEVVAIAQHRDDKSLDITVFKNPLGEYFFLDQKFSTEAQAVSSAFNEIKKF